MNKWKIAGTEVKGKKHIKANKPCQDKIYSINNKKTSFIALADGAGSVEHSHIGASLTTIVTGKILENMFDKLFHLNEYEISKVIMANLNRLLIDKANEIKTTTKQLSSTLLFVALSRGRYIAGHLGDGVIGKLIGDKIAVMSHPDNGEYANQTYFTTSDDAINHIRIYKGFLIDETGFILMSDGSAECLYDRKNKVLSEVSRQMLEWLDTNTEQEVESALLDNVKSFFLSKTSDDCSLNMMRKVCSSEILNNVNKVFQKLRIWFYDRSAGKL